MRCKKCGSELTDTMKFCGECGAPVKTTETNKFCTQCGNKLHDGLSFCPYCGTKIEKRDQAVMMPSNTEHPQISVQKIQNEYYPDKYKYKEKFMGETYKVVFTRPWKYSQLGNIKVEIDGSSTKYDLRNGKSFEVRLPEGSHSVKFTSFMVAAKSEMSVNIDRDRTFSVAPAKTIFAAAGIIPTVALQAGKPLVKVTDEDGKIIV